MTLAELARSARPNWEWVAQTHLASFVAKCDDKCPLRTKDGCGMTAASDACAGDLAYIKDALGSGRCAAAEFYHPLTQKGQCGC